MHFSLFHYDIICFRKLGPRGVDLLRGGLLRGRGGGRRRPMGGRVRGAVRAERVRRLERCRGGLGRARREVLEHVNHLLGSRVNSGDTGFTGQSTVRKRGRVFCLEAKTDLFR